MPPGQGPSLGAVGGGKEGGHRAKAASSPAVNVPQDPGVGGGLILGQRDGQRDGLPQSPGDLTGAEGTVSRKLPPSPYPQRAHRAAIHQKASHWEPRTAPAPHVQLLVLWAEPAGHQA